MVGSVTIDESTLLRFAPLFSFKESEQYWPVEKKKPEKTNSQIFHSVSEIAHLLLKDINL